MCSLAAVGVDRSIRKHQQRYRDAARNALLTASVSRPVNQQLRLADPPGPAACPPDYSSNIYRSLTPRLCEPPILFSPILFYARRIVEAANARKRTVHFLYAAAIIIVWN